MLPPQSMMAKMNNWDATGPEMMQQVMKDFAIYDLELRSGFLVPVSPMDRLSKTAADLTTATSGAYNALFTAVAVIQQVQNQNAHGAFGKRGYPREGFRATSGVAYSSGVGVAQGATVGTPQVPDYVEITVGQKEIEAVIEITSRMELVATKNDTITYDSYAQTVYTNFMDALDTDLLVDFDTQDGNNIESVDRLHGSSAEAIALSYTTSDEDIYAQDRDASPWYAAPATAIHAFDGYSLHNSGTDRYTSLPLIDSLYANVRPYWDTYDNKFWLTEDLTWVDWSALESPKQRHGEDTFVQTMNGIQTAEGGKGGYKLSTYNGHPIIIDPNVELDTKGRIYLNDQDHIGIVQGRQVEFKESDNWFEVGHNRRGAWYGIEELWGDKPRAGGKLRDLK